jgi:hypothetical protein
MAGMVHLDEDVAWSPAGWVYDNVLRQMSLVLANEAPLLSQMLLDSTVEVNGGYLDLRNLDPQDFARIEQAAKDTYRLFESRGSESFSGPEFFKGFMDRLDELVRLLACTSEARRAG